MSLDWLVRDNEVKDHNLFGDEFLGTEAPCTMYEKKPLINPNTGEPVEGLSVAWVTLNNPAQYGSYTTQMVKGVIAGMHKGSMDRDVQAIILQALVIRHSVQVETPRSMRNITPRDRSSTYNIWTYFPVWWMLS